VRIPAIWARDTVRAYAHPGPDAAVAHFRAFCAEWDRLPGAVIEQIIHGWGRQRV